MRADLSQTLFQQKRRARRSFVMKYCEMWLENLGKQFRVVILVPNGFEVPEGFNPLSVPPPKEDSTLYGSVWFPKIHGGKDEINAAASFYGERSIKFLFFQEIRRFSGE